MAEIIKYNLASVDEDGTVVQGPECSMPYSEENLALAQSEAYGEVSVEEDGQPEPVQETTQEDVTLDLLADHEYRLCMLELGGETV